MDEQQRVVSFIESHELETPPVYRVLDLVSETGEIAKDAAESTAYGSNPSQLDIKTDEIGDVIFSLLALAAALDIDAGDALDEALEKYRGRIDAKDAVSSGS